jgi:cytoskeletal protein CcmA (bactofilin family)
MKIDENLTIYNIVTENITVVNSSELIVLGTVNGNITIESNSSSIIHGIVNGIIYNYGSCKIFGTIYGNVIGENIKIDQNAIIIKNK